MTAFRARLTDVDIRRLIKSSDDDERAAAAHKLCRTMERSVMSDIEREAALKIVRVLASDAAELVRRAMVVTLKSSDLIPRDVARRLAADVESIAMPIINHCPAFTDDDLIEIVRAGSSIRQTAVAGRGWVSRDVAAVLAEDGSHDAVRALAANDNADISEASLGVVVSRFGGSREIVTALAYRHVLPPGITERLIEAATDAVREHLVTRHALAPETAIRLARSTRERATVDLVDEASSAADLKQFVSQLNARGVLSASLLLRALARGRMSLFEHGLAELAGATHSRAWLMIHDAGPLGLKAIYDRAGLPPRLFAAFRAGVDTWRSIQSEGGETVGERFQQRMLERYMTQRPNAPKDDLSYLLERLDQPTDVIDDIDWDRSTRAA